MKWSGYIFLDPERWATHNERVVYHLLRLAAEAHRNLDGCHLFGVGVFHLLMSAKMSSLDTTLIPSVLTSGF